MLLDVAARVGPYEILSALGAGGMGEVYRAHDTKLSRDVAIKILPQAFVSDPERVARFQREARTLASLNHPNIGGTYGLEEAMVRRRSCWNWWRDPPSPTGLPKGRFQSTTRWQSPARSPRRSRPRMSRGSSTAISSLRTSKSGQTAVVGGGVIGKVSASIVRSVAFRGMEWLPLPMPRLTGLE